LIDRVIRECVLRDPVSYRRFDDALAAAEAKLRDAGERDLLSETCSQRIFLAAGAEEYETVLTKSESFLREFPTSSGASNVLAWRLRALHATGSHEQEVEEAISAAVGETLDPDTLVSALGSLATRHPGSVPDRPEIWDVLEAAVRELRAGGLCDFTNLPYPSEGVEVFLSSVVEQRRRAYRERTRQVLDGE